MSNESYGFGNSVCVLNGDISQIKGRLNDCPSGFKKSTDGYGNPVCSDGNIQAYKLSSGCPNGSREFWNEYGSKTCVDLDDHVLIELVD